MIDCMQAFVSKVYPSLVFPLLYLGFLRIVLGPVNLFLGLLSDLKKKIYIIIQTFNLQQPKKAEYGQKNPKKRVKLPSE